LDKVTKPGFKPQVEQQSEENILNIPSSSVAVTTNLVQSTIISYHWAFMETLDRLVFRDADRCTIHIHDMVHIQGNFKVYHNHITSIIYHSYVILTIKY